MAGLLVAFKMPVDAVNLQGEDSFSKLSGHGPFSSWHRSWNWAPWKSSKGCPGVKGGNLMHLHFLGWCFSALAAQNTLKCCILESSQKL